MKLKKEKTIKVKSKNTNEHVEKILNDLKNYKWKGLVRNESMVNNKIIKPFCEENKIPYERLECKSIGAGVPDWLLYVGCFIFIEVKFGNNKTRASQNAFFKKFPTHRYLLIFKNDKINIVNEVK